MPAPAITLLTDFGTADGYVAELKGVLLSNAPGVPLIDLTHDIAAQDVEAARLAFARYWRRFPEGTVHLVVVDPGVGSPRSALAIEADGRYAVGPDNGALSPCLLALNPRTVAVPIPPGASRTFHGRDLFAPVAAALAMDSTLDEIGVPHPSPIVWRSPQPRRVDAWTIEGQILTIDHFGNALTNLLPRPNHSVHLGGRALRLCGAYAELVAGELGALTGSNGFLELVMADTSAAIAYDLRRGQKVSLSSSSGG